MKLNDVGQPTERERIDVFLKEHSVVKGESLSGKDFVLREGQEFELPKMPGTKILVAKVSEESITLSFILPGKTERQEQELKIK